MYTSKYYTCEQIDQRLLQGYFDDAVLRGFIGTLNEFWQFIFSIRDKANSKDVKKALEELDIKLREAIEEARVTKVSQLENDLKYQTKDEVEAYISKLVNGADEALDTLLELAEALGNDPNFAATMAKALGDLQKQIDTNTAHNKEVFLQIQEAIKEEITKREAGDQDQHTELLKQVGILNTSLNNIYNNLDQKIQNINNTLLTFQKDYNKFKEQTTEKITTLEKELSQNFGDKIQKETERATLRENEIETGYKEADKKLEEKITQNTTDISNEITTREAEDTRLESLITQEAAERVREDANLQTKIGDEANARVQGDADLQSRIDAESASRKEAVSQVTSDLNTERNERQITDENLQNQINNQTLKHDKEVNDLKEAAARETARVNAALEDKVDKVEGKGLSTNDFTDALLEKLNGIDANAKLITRVSELINDANFVNIEQVNEAIQKVIGTAPEVLDTLQELADALGNDPNFSTTILNKISALATQLNEEVQNREIADEQVKKELVAEIEKATQNLTNSYNVLSERLNTYKSLCDKNYENLTHQISDLDTKIDEKTQLYLDKLLELSNSYSEKVQSLTNTVNQFTSNILNRVNNQAELITQNTAHIQRNLELIQALQSEITGIKDTENKNFNTLMDLIRSEADARKAEDTALGKRIDNTNKALDELEKYVKNNTNIQSTETIKITKEASGDNTIIKASAIVKEDDSLLSTGPEGIQSELTLKKEETGEGLTYHLLGKGGKPLPNGDIEIPKVMGEEFTEGDAEALYNKIYGEAFNPDAPGALQGMTPEEAKTIYDEVYDENNNPNI